MRFSELKFMLAIMALLGSYVCAMPSWPQRPYSIVLNMESGCFYAASHRGYWRAPPDYECLSADEFASVKAGSPSAAAKRKLDSVDQSREEQAAEYARLKKQADYDADHLWEYNKARLEKLLSVSR